MREEGERARRVAVSPDLGGYTGASQALTCSQGRPKRGARARTARWWRWHADVQWWWWWLPSCASQLERAAAPGGVSWGSERNETPMPTNTLRTLAPRMCIRMCVRSAAEAAFCKAPPSVSVTTCLPPNQPVLSMAALLLSPHAARGAGRIENGEASMDGGRSNGSGARGKKNVCCLGGDREERLAGSREECGGWNAFQSSRRFLQPKHTLPARVGGGRCSSRLRTAHRRRLARAECAGSPTHELQHPPAPSTLPAHQVAPSLP